MKKEKVSAGEAIMHAGALRYQKGSIVSQQITKKSTGTITLFAFDRNQGLSEHTAPFDAVVYIIDGTAEITISGKRHVVKKDDYIVLPAHKPHALQAIEKFKMMLIMIKSK
ncbi:MAG: cupin domain-containing protein [Endomicrobiales bacterium]|jgi:quercetin dioxygenase-like cupin family protein